MPGRALRRDGGPVEPGAGSPCWNPRMPGRALRPGVSGKSAHWPRWVLESPNARKGIKTRPPGAGPGPGPPRLESPNARKGIKTPWFPRLGRDSRPRRSWNPRMPGRALRPRGAFTAAARAFLGWNPRMPGRALRLQTAPWPGRGSGRGLESPNARKGIKTHPVLDFRPTINQGWNPRMPGRALRRSVDRWLHYAAAVGWNPRMPGRALRPACWR